MTLVHLPIAASPLRSDAVISAHIDAVRFQRCPVLLDIDMAIPGGQWTAIVGPNGAGKSTLLRTLAGLQACEGEVRLRDRPLVAWPAKERARELAWLGQGETGADDLRAHDVVMLGRLPHQAWLASPSAADEAAVQHAMEQTQSWPWRERRFGSLSGGERQRVLLARALAVRAPVLLMDEPLAHLDAPHQADWLLIVRELTAHGVAVVSVLHELGIALQADALVVMAQGRVVHHGASDSAETRAALQQVFEQRLKFVQIDERWWALPHTAAGQRG